MPGFSFAGDKTLTPEQRSFITEKQELTKTVAQLTKRLTTLNQEAYQPAIDLCKELLKSLLGKKISPDFTLIAEKKRIEMIMNHIPLHMRGQIAEKLENPFLQNLIQEDTKRISIEETKQKPVKMSTYEKQIKSNQINKKAINIINQKISPREKMEKLRDLIQLCLKDGNLTKALEIYHYGLNEKMAMGVPSIIGLNLYEIKFDKENFIDLIDKLPTGKKVFSSLLKQTMNWSKIKKDLYLSFTLVILKKYGAKAKEEYVDRLIAKRIMNQDDYYDLEPFFRNGLEEQ